MALVEVNNLSKIYGDVQAVDGISFEIQQGEIFGLLGPNLAEHARRRVEHYSGGMKRRLNLAVGLLGEPRFLMLDEPTVGVDPQSRNAIFGNIQALNRQGLTILYTTHYMEEAELLCDRVAIMDGGQIIALDTPLAQADPPHHHADHPGLLGHRRFLVPAVHDAQGGATGDPHHPRRLGDGGVQLEAAAISSSKVLISARASAGVV